MHINADIEKSHVKVEKHSNHLLNKTTYRINLIHDNPKDNIVIQVIDNTTYEAAKLYVEWQIPQYTLVGLGEVFCSVSCKIIFLFKFFKQK